MWNSISIIDLPQLPASYCEEIQGLSRDKIRFLRTGELLSCPETEVLLTSIYVTLNRTLLKSCPKLRYIGIYGTNLKNVDLLAAKELEIEVRNVRNYCDSDTAELVIAELLMMTRGFGKLPWRNEFNSCHGRKLGIIGMGAIGRQVLKLGLALGMEISYTSKSSKPDLVTAGFQEKEELLTESEVISLHTPPFVPVLSRRDFQLIRRGSILISTVQGRVWDVEGMREWLQDSGNRLILDQFAFSQLSDEDRTLLSGFENVRVSPVAAYRTTESAERIARIFFTDLREYSIEYFVSD